MEYFQFCLKVLMKEEERFNVKLACTDITDLMTSGDTNFDMVYNRCAYMYKCATCQLHFVHDCLNKFLSECDLVNEIVSKWMLSSNSKLCSFSIGPGVEYMAFLLAFAGYECFKVQSIFKSTKIITKYGAWRNTLNFMLEAIVEGNLSNLSPLMIENDMQVIQGDPYAMLSQKVKEVVQDSDVILMVKTLNLTSPDNRNGKDISSLMELFTIMKPETILFCIDTKPSCALFIECLSKFTGSFLFGPTHISGKLPTVFPEAFKETYGYFPTLSARGSFFVWKKLNLDSCENVISLCENSSLLADCTYRLTDSNFCNISVSSNSSILCNQLDEDKLALNSGSTNDHMKYAIQDEYDKSKSVQDFKENPSEQSLVSDNSEDISLSNMLISDSIRHNVTSPQIVASNETLQSENQNFATGTSVFCNIPLLKSQKKEISINVPQCKILQSKSVSSIVTIPENKIDDETFQSKGQNFTTVNNYVQEILDGFERIVNVSQKQDVKPSVLGSHSCFSLECKSANIKEEKAEKHEKIIQTCTPNFRDQSVQVGLPFGNQGLKSSDIKSLTTRIEILTSSFEELLKQKHDEHNCFNVDESPSNENSQVHNCVKSNPEMSNDCRICHEYCNSKPCFSNASAGHFLQRERCITNDSKKPACQCFSCHSNSPHSVIQNCSLHCHNPHICNLRTHSCCLPCRPSVSSNERNISPVVPNIVIPLENVNSDILCQIITLLKKT